MKPTKRTDQIAADLFNYGGATYTITKLGNFLGVSYDMAANIIRRNQLQPMCGTNTGKRYYYRDIAEAIGRGA